jgi:hypothetical protein
MTFPTRVLYCPGSRFHAVSYLHYYDSGPLAARSMRPGLVVVGISAFQRRKFLYRCGSRDISFHDVCTFAPVEV